MDTKALNGWQRLFVLFSAITALVVGALIISGWPTRSSTGVESVYGCMLNENLVPPDRARNLLRLGHIPASENYNYPSKDLAISGECATELQLVANGDMYGHRVREFWGRSFSNIVGAMAFLTVIYVLGAALGWVWRGFFPKRGKD